MLLSPPGIPNPNRRVTLLPIPPPLPAKLLMKKKRRLKKKDKEKATLAKRHRGENDAEKGRRLYSEKLPQHSCWRRVRAITTLPRALPSALPPLIHPLLPATEKPDGGLPRLPAKNAFALLAALFAPAVKAALRATFYFAETPRAPCQKESRRTRAGRKRGDGDGDSVMN